jgi:O-antigen ligase
MSGSMIWRPDLILLSIFERIGPLALVLAVGIFAYVAFGRLVRAFLLAVLVLVCTQVWWGPLSGMANSMRWLLLIILFARGILYVLRHRAPPGESRLARRLVGALAVLALLSVGWSGHEVFSLRLAVSFCLGLFVALGLLWRLADDDSVMQHFARGALVFSIIIFGAGFVVAGVSYLTDSWRFFDATKLGWGRRYSGVFYNPNAGGLIGAMLLPILVASPREFLGRLAFATIFLSGSRSALIGSAMAVVVLGMYRWGAGAFVTMCLGGAAVAALAVYTPLDDIWIEQADASAVGHIVRTKHLATLSGRVDLWQSGWDEAQGHLLFGQGWGANRVFAGDVDIDRAAEIGHVQGGVNLHNAHLQLLIDVGIVGVGLFWAFCAIVMHAGWVILRAPRSPRNGLGLVIFTSTLALLADTWVHGAIWSMGSPTTLAFWGLCVLTLKEADRVRREAFAVPPPPAPAERPAPAQPFAPA